MINGTDAYTYDAFGNQLTSMNDTNPFRYCGEYFDTETGFIYLRNRYYNPSTGRFISEDPIKDGTNWYVYCGNNPVMFVDPSGLVLKLNGTGDEVQAIWQNLKKLTDDELVLTQDRVEVGDGQYQLLDSYAVTIATENNGSHSVGTNLVRRIINNVYTCSVENSSEPTHAKPIMHQILR